MSKLGKVLAATYSVAMMFGMLAVVLVTVPAQADTQTNRCVVYPDGTIHCAGCHCSGGQCTCTVPPS
jgi:hypothetical protein